jgi:hypothetical protein
MALALRVLNRDDARGKAMVRWCAADDELGRRCRVTEERGLIRFGAGTKEGGCTWRHTGLPFQ